MALKKIVKNYRWVPISIAYLINGVLFNLVDPAIDYKPSRFKINKKETIMGEYYPEKTYALIVTGFPQGNPGLVARNRQIRKICGELEKDKSMDSTLISYEDCEDATEMKLKLEDKLKEISNDVTDKDCFIFAYSGHGGKGDGEGTIALDFKNGIIATEIGHYLNTIPAKYKILAFDSCYSGNVAETLKGKGRIVISSGSRDHITAAFPWSDGLVATLFSNKTGTDRDKNGKISLEESFISAAKNDWFTNYTNVFLQLPRQRHHLFSEGIDPNAVYLLNRGEE